MPSTRSGSPPCCCRCGQDWSHAQIAAKLFVSEATVKTHINRVYAKLALRDRHQASLKARALGV